MRSLRVAGDQRLLPGRQIGIKLDERLRRLFLDPRDFLADVGPASGQGTQFVYLGVEFGDGFFEIQIGAHVIRHQINIGGRARRQAKRGRVLG